MISHTGSSRTRPIDKIIARVHLLYQIGEELLKLILRARNFNIHQSGRIKKTIDMLVNCKQMIVSGRSCIIHAISEETYPVIERDCHLIQFVHFSIVITQCFHAHTPPCSISLRAATISRSVAMLFPSTVHSFSCVTPSTLPICTVLPI